MFDKIKQLNKLKELENSLGKELVKKEIKEVKVVVNGKAEIVSIELNPELSKEEQEQVLKECINKALEEAKIMMAKRDAEISGFNF